MCDGMVTENEGESRSLLSTGAFQRRRFYFKRLILEAFASETARLVTCI